MTHRAQRNSIKAWYRLFCGLVVLGPLEVGFHRSWKQLAKIHCVCLHIGRHLSFLLREVVDQSRPVRGRLERSGPKNTEKCEQNTAYRNGTLWFIP